MPTMAAGGDTARAPGVFERLLLAVTALAASVAVGLWTPTADQPVSGRADPLNSYTMTATDQTTTRIVSSMPLGVFGQASAVAVGRAGREAGKLTTLRLSDGAQMRMTMGGLNLDRFLKDVMQAFYAGQLSEDAIDLAITGRTRVASLHAFGGLTAIWVQEDSLMLFEAAAWDRGPADQFLRDYLAT